MNVFTSLAGNHIDLDRCVTISQLYSTWSENGKLDDGYIEYTTVYNGKPVKFDLGLSYTGHKTDDTYEVTKDKNKAIREVTEKEYDRLIYQWKTV